MPTKATRYGSSCRRSSSGGASSAGNSFARRFVSHGNFLFAPVVAWLLCVPKYLSGAMSLGELTQSAAAFVTVQGAFNWLVDNYQRLADWRSSAHRVATLLIALDELEAKEVPRVRRRNSDDSNMTRSVAAAYKR